MSDYKFPSDLGRNLKIQKLQLMFNIMPEGKRKATGCFAFPCSHCPSAISGTTIASVCGSKNKSYPSNICCKRTLPALKILDYSLITHLYGHAWLVFTGFENVKLVTALL